MDGCLSLQRMAKFLCIIFLACSIPAFADIVNNEWYSSVRALSMGNAVIAAADNPVDAMFYNPAFLAKIKQSQTSLELINPQIEMGLGNFSISKDTSDILQQRDLGKAAPLLDSDRNKGSYFNTAFYPNISAQNFALGFLIRTETSAYVNGDSTELNYKSRYLMMPTLGLSAGLIGGRMKIGLAVRAIQITENDKKASQVSAASSTQAANYGTVDFQANPDEGFGFGLDAGMSLTLPWTALPTIGVVARNIGDTSFPNKNPPFYSFGTGITSRHDSIKSTYDIGFSIAPKLGRGSTFLLAADYRDAMNRYDVNTLRRVNIGMELSFNKHFYLRLGARSGYWAAGIGISGQKASLDFGSYADELHATDYQKIEDRRVAIRYGGRF